MLINTKNFLLYLLSVGFLVLAIVFTLARGQTSSGVSDIPLGVDHGSGEDVYVAEVALPHKLDREAHLISMRQKIGNNQIISKPAETIEKAPKTEEVPEKIAVTGKGPKLCDAYQPLIIDWAPSEVKFEVVEGARLMYREIESNESVSTSSGSLEQPVVSSREVYLQLPLHTSPLFSKSCIGNDVIGVALKGSLIRNSEISLYSIFSGSTIIGYALDGFPIYGLDNQAKLDECGGVLLNGEYRYQLASSRKEILHCYSGVPIKI